MTTRRPFALHGQLDGYKHDCLEYGLDTEFFHCSEDNPRVRRKVFGLIEKHLGDISIDSLVVEKRKTTPSLREERRFYPEMLGRLLRYVVTREMQNSKQEIMVITDTLPLNRKRRAIEKAVRLTLKSMLPEHCRFRILHHASKSHFGLQTADYCNWAILRKWARSDHAYYDQIKPALLSELEIFGRDTTTYY